MKTNKYYLMTREERIFDQVHKVRAYAALTARYIAKYNDYTTWSKRLIDNYRVAENLIKLYGMEEEYPLII